MASCRDEELVEIVNQFPVLYDQSHSHFQRKDIKVMRGKKLQMILSLNMVSAEKLNLFVPEAAVEIFSWKYMFWKSLKNICKGARLGKMI